MTAGIPDGEPKSREDWKLERLNYWLSEKKPWSGSPNHAGNLPWPEGVCILAGIDPELSELLHPTKNRVLNAQMEHSAAGLFFLPGALRFYGFEAFPRDHDELESLWDAVTRHIGELNGLRLKTAKPERWIDRAQRADITIPWQEARVRFAQQKRRRTQHETEDAVKLLNGFGRAKFEEIRKLGYVGFRFKTSGRINTSAVAHAIHEALGEYTGWDGSEPQERTVRKYVTDWLES